MDPKQCKAARSLLGWTQQRLAKSAGVGLSSLQDFEGERRATTAVVIGTLERALQKAGVEFIAENGGGPGVRLRIRTKKR
jgi:transcriptional regulator with XRE-family HTH domain